MLKRLIEVALPLKEVSEQSAREKSIRHGHISTLHIWWARRPLAACRAVVFASLIPDPDAPECPESFRSLVHDVLKENEFKPKNGDGSPLQDTPRNRCLEFIKHLVRWENSNKCRKRSVKSSHGLWDDVRKELKKVARERLDFFWSQGIRGADFFISAIGPALSVFGKYERVTKLSGEEVTVGQFLDEVRGLVTAYALNKIMKTTQTANIDPESRFYVIWKWSYGDARVPADESFKLAQALGIDTAIMWDRTGVLEKAGENILAVPVAKRMRMKDLGEPNADSTPVAEFMDEHAERAYESLEKVLGRIEKVRQTVEGTEIYEVIRRRLFEDLGDRDQHRATAEAYWAMYRQLGEDVPAACREPAYRDDLLAAYPFHPELISILYERWGTIPSFQRTRGVLRLLADVISDQYQAKVNEPVIQSSSINLGSAAVRGELVKHTGAGSVFHSVVDSDIAGKQAKAPEIDRQLGSEYAKESVAEKCARASFMYSFGGGQQRGATLPQIRLAVLNPEMAPPFIADALDRMTKRLWYLYHDSGLYRFESRPNLNRILVDREEMIRSEPDKVRDFAKATLNDLIGDATFRVYRYPEPGDDRFVADEPRLGLVVLDLNQGATEDGLPKETAELVTRILKQHGKGFRKHANMLVFLAPDPPRSSEVIDAARRLLALRNIDEDKPTKKQLAEEQLKDLADRLKEAEARLPAALATAYRHVLVPGEKKTVRCFDMGISSFSGRTTLSSKVLEKLMDEQQVLDKLDPAVLIGTRFGLWPEDQEMVNIRTLADYFTQLTHLPRLHGPQVLLDCLARGVQRGLFGYALGDADNKHFDTIHFNEKDISVIFSVEKKEGLWEG